MLDMAIAMLWIFFPGVYLGFTMMPWWWLLAAGVSIVAAFLFWRRSSSGQQRTSKALWIASGSLALAAAFYLASVRTAYEACRQPPADGFCMFDGLPLLSLCALYLLIGVVASFKWAWLRSATRPGS